MPAVQMSQPQRGHSSGRGAVAPSIRATAAFWIGLSVVLLSLVSAFATYLILTGLTPIAPRNEVVLTVLFINILLIIAMVARDRLAGHRPVARLARQGCPARGCTSASSRCSASSPRCRRCCWRSPPPPPSRARSTAGSPPARAPSCELARRRQRLSRRARPGDPHRHRQHGARTSTMRAASVARRPDASCSELVMAQAGLRDLPVAYVVDAEGVPVIAAMRGREAALHRAAEQRDARRPRRARCRC